MTSLAYEIRPYTESFRDQILELQTHHWGANAERNAAYLQWKYYENPYIEEPCITLALQEDRVVGMRGMYGACWQAGEPAESFVGPCAGDVVIHPTHRGHGLFDRMMQCAEAELARRGYRYAFNLSSSATTYINCLKLGWEGIGSLGHVKRAARKRKRIAAVWGSLWSAPAADTPRPEAMAQLVRHSTRHGRIRHVRDAAYLSWRFRNPFSRYRFLFEPEAPSADLHGFLVLQHPVDEPSTLHIVDWEADDPGIFAGLLERAIRSKHQRRLETWSGCASPADQSRLRQSGFSDARGRGFIFSARPTVLVRELETQRSDPVQPPLGRIALDRDQWDVRMVFSDAF